MRPPVRLFAMALAAVSMIVFVGVLGWGNAERSRAAAMPARLPVQQGPATDQPPPAPVTQSPQGVARGTTRPAGTTHVVAAGDTLFRIAQSYRVSVDQIRIANGLSSDRIQPGQALLVPGADPLRQYRVEQGDTLWEIAARYGVDINELLAVNRRVGDPGHLQIGEVLTLPAKASAGTPAASLPEQELSLGGVFAWPNTAPISSLFGPRWGRNHAGIDLAANQGDPIKAARGGRVELAGEVQGYGNTVIIQHPDGTRTLYAHTSKLLVRSGQNVQQGDLIALVGSTGNSTGPHLHFEIIVNGKPRNPLLYLPKK